MARAFKLLIAAKAGASAVEYALVASLIAVAAVAGMSSLGTKQGAQWNNVDNNL